MLEDHLISEVIMFQSAWFGLVLLSLVSVTLMVCVAALFYIIRLNKSDKTTSEQVVALLAKISEQTVYITERHEHMTDILATVSNEFLKLRQKENCTCGKSDKER